MCTYCVIHAGIYALCILYLRTARIASFFFFFLTQHYYLRLTEKRIVSNVINNYEKMRHFAARVFQNLQRAQHFQALGHHI